MTDVLLKRRNLGRDKVCVEEGLCENTGRILTTSQDVREVTRSWERVSCTALRRNQPGDTWILDFRPPERDRFLFFEASQFVILYYSSSNTLIVYLGGKDWNIYKQH